MADPRGGRIDGITAGGVQRDGLSCASACARLQSHDPTLAEWQSTEASILGILWRKVRIWVWTGEPLPLVVADVCAPGLVAAGRLHVLGNARMAATVVDCW